MFFLVAMEPQVYLLSAPSNAGKTTALVKYVDVLRKEGKTVGGVLQIVKSGRRHIHYLSSDTSKLLQMNDVHAHNINHDRHYTKRHGTGGGDGHCNHECDPQNDQDFDEEKYIKCGKFLFSKDALNDAQNELTNAYKYDFVMIDEIGNWELKKQKGYEPAFSNILKQRKDKFKHTKFIIVVRPSLKDQLIRHLHLNTAEYSEFENLCEWQLSAKVCKRCLFVAFMSAACIIARRLRQ